MRLMMLDGEGISLRGVLYVTPDGVGASTAL